MVGGLLSDMRKEIVVLGATGSIGTQTLDILMYSFDYELVGVSLSSRFEVLEPYLFYFDSLKYVAIEDEKAALKFHKLHPSYVVISGKDCSVRLVEICSKADVFNSLMGNCGLLPSLKAIEQGQDLLLSNKESLVIGSTLIKPALKKSKSHLYPVDSEHVGLAKLLKEAKRLGIKKNQIRKLIVTASGGALRDYPKKKLDNVSPDVVLKHPTWHMGSKITVDSATLVNKAFEVIEASVLFDFPLEKVDAIICRESLVHAELIYEDENGEHTLLEYSPCSMKVAISYALSKGTLSMHRNSEEDLENIRKLHFADIDHEFYPLFDVTRNVFSKYSNVGMIYYNAVDTYAIEMFLKKKMLFAQLRDSLVYAFSHMDSLPVLDEKNLDSIISASEEFAKDVVWKVVSLSR